MNQIETPFSGGHSTSGVVKVGETVHRPVNTNSEFTRSLLMLLEKKNYPFSPRFLGMDEQGREILTYIDGSIGRGDFEWSEVQLLTIVRMIKQFHDATEGSDLAGDKEIVCHNDLAPWNTVLKDNKPLAFIDFDDCTPGNRIDDFAYFLWTFLELGSEKSADFQVKRIKLLFDEYGMFTAKEVIDSILNQQNIILLKRIFLSQNASSEEDRAFSKERIGKIESEIRWVELNREEIEKYLLN